MSGEDLKAFVDGELPPWKRWLAARKIARDPALQAEVEALRKLSDELAALELPQAPLSDSLRTRLLATAPESGPIRVPSRRSPTKIVAFGLVGASMLAVFAVMVTPKPKSAETKAAAPVAAAPAAPTAVSEAAKAESEGASITLATPSSTYRSLDTNTTADSALRGRLSTAEGDLSDSSAPSSRNSMTFAQPLDGNFNLDKTRGGGGRGAGATLRNSTPRVDAARARYSAKYAAQAIQAPERKEVITITPDRESLSELRIRVENAVKEHGGKVLKQEPLEVTLPSHLQSSTRLKLLALLVTRSDSERKKASAALAESSKSTALRVTVYFRD